MPWRERAIGELLLGGAANTAAQRCTLFRLAGEFDLDAVETGTCTGGATVAIARGLRPGRVVYTFDPHRAYGRHNYDDPAYAQLLAANLWATGLDGPGSPVRVFAHEVAAWRPDPPPRLGLAFIDGDHAEAACWADVECIWPWLAPGGHLVLHDCPGEAGVERVQAHLLNRGRAVLHSRVQNMSVLAKRPLPPPGGAVSLPSA